MQKTLQEIAQHVNGEIVGDKSLVITGICGIKEAQKGDLSFIANSKYSPLAEKTKASAIIAPRGLSVPGKSLIRVDNPSLAFANVVSLFIEDLPKPSPGIHPTAIVATDARLGNKVSIGPYAVIEPKAQVGDNTIIGSGSYVGHSAKVGRDTHLYPNVTLRERVIIGDRVIVHCGAVIGSDGFGFINIEGAHHKIPQVGTVVVEDDVEIGANTTIDRARFDKTIIGRGTKIDNLVQIGHNVNIGQNCIIVSLVGIAGSVTIEDGVVMAGQSGAAGHLTIGKGSIVTAQTGVIGSIPPNSVVFGMPAKPLAQAKRVNACMQKLPEYVKRIKELEVKIENLESQLKKKNGKTKNNKE